jgi:Cu2+-containing amine oxidase
MRMHIVRALLFLILSATSATAQEGYIPQHPMDALTPEEIKQAAKILKDSGVAHDGALFPIVVLREMPKDYVLAWKPNDPIERQAFVISRENDETTESVVDIDAGRVLSHKAVPGAQPMITDGEWLRDPNLSHGGDGLPQFVGDKQSLQNEDIVVWYIMGFRHLPKPEDFPILPTFWHEVTLSPAYFFDRDPSSRLNAQFAAPQE